MVTAVLLRSTTTTAHVAGPEVTITTMDSVSTLQITVHQLSRSQIRQATAAKVSKERERSVPNRQYVRRHHQYVRLRQAVPVAAAAAAVVAAVQAVQVVAAMMMSVQTSKRNVRTRVKRKVKIPVRKRTNPVKGRKEERKTVKLIRISAKPGTRDVKQKQKTTTMTARNRSSK
mgnify:FL=1